MDIFENPYVMMLDAMRGEGKRAAKAIKTGPVEGTLTSADPPAVTALGMELDAEDLVVNVDLELSALDVGKTMLLISSADGQKYYLVARLS